MPVLVVKGIVNPVSFAPTLLTPPNGTYLDLSVGQTFTWQYNPGGANPQTFVAGGSTGVAVSTFSGSGVLHVVSVSPFPSGGGTLQVATSTGTATITYAGVSTSGGDQRFTGCTTTAGSGTLYAGNIVIAPALLLSQTGYAFARLTNGGSVAQFWNNGSSTWQSTPVYNTSTSQSLTFPAAAWIDGNIYQWSVSTQDVNGIGPFAGYFTINAQMAPSVIVTAPSGSISTADPLVTWAVNLAPGAQQTSWRLVIYNSTQYSAGGFALPTSISAAGTSPSVYDSGQQGGSYVFSVDLSVIPIYLPTGVSYRAYVIVTETGSQSSPWAHSSFSTSYTPPTTPTIVATQTTDTSGCPIISLLVTGANTPYNGLQQAIILRNGTDGSSVYVRNASPLNPAAIPATSPYQVTVEDFELIPGVQYTYVAQIVVITGTNASVISASASSATIHFSTTKCWEFNPLNPSATAIAAQVIEWEPQITEQSTAHIVMGQAVPNVVANVMGGLDGQGTFETFDPVTYTALQALLTSQATIFISLPFGGTDSGFVRFGPQTGGMSTGTGNKTLDSSLMPSTIANMHRTTAITFVAQARPPV